MRSTFYFICIYYVAQIYYVGHSMGTTTYMAMNSMDPTWADKVSHSEMLAILVSLYFWLHHERRILVKLAKLSQIPKVELAVLLAPVAFVDHMNSPIKVGQSFDCF